MSRSFHFALLACALLGAGCNALVGLGEPTVSDGGTTGAGTGTGTSGTGTTGASTGTTGTGTTGAGTGTTAAGTGTTGAGGGSGGSAGAGVGGGAGTGQAGQGGTTVTDPLAPFLGRWIGLGTGTSRLSNCDNGAMPTPSTGVSFGMNVVRGTSSNLLITDDGGCEFEANVTGNRADIVAGQLCEGPNLELITEVGSYFSYLSLSTGLVHFTGYVTLYQSGATVTCNFSQDYPVSVSAAAQ